MSAMGSQITSLTIVYSTVYSGADQRKYQSFASLAFVRGIYRWAVNSPHKWPVTRNILPFDDVIMLGWGIREGTLAVEQNNTPVGEINETFQWDILFNGDKFSMSYIDYHIEAETKWPTFSRLHFAMHFLKENVGVFNMISMKFVPKGEIDNNTTLVQMIAWHRIGDKPLSESMLA